MFQMIRLKTWNYFTYWISEYKIADVLCDQLAEQKIVFV